MPGPMSIGATAAASPFARPSPDAALLRLARAIKDSGYRFTTVTPATHARVNSRPGADWADSAEAVFGWSRPFRARLLPPEWFELMRAAGVAEPYRHPSGESGWRSLVRLSSLDGQLFVHSAYPTTEADAVFFGPDSYRFVAAIRARYGPGPAGIGRAADIGCGAGPGAIVLALDQPRAQVLAVDINPAALRLTHINAALAGTGNVVARCSDLLSAVDGLFDVIVSNPPYLLDPAERAYRHGGGALGAGLALAVIDTALERLAPGGSLLLYTGAAIEAGADRFRAAAAERVADSDFSWTYRELDPDVFGEELASPAYAGVDRIAAVLLTATRPSPA